MFIKLWNSFACYSFATVRVKLKRADFTSCSFVQRSFKFSDFHMEAEKLIWNVDTRLTFNFFTATLVQISFFLFVC